MRHGSQPFLTRRLSAMAGKTTDAKIKNHNRKICPFQAGGRAGQARPGRGQPGQAKLEQARPASSQAGLGWAGPSLGSARPSQAGAGQADNTKRSIFFVFVAFQYDNTNRLHFLYFLYYGTIIQKDCTFCIFCITVR